MPYSEYERIRRDRRVRWAAPFGLGDNYEGFRIVGMEQHFFELPDRAGEPFFRFERGRAFEDRFEVVLGSRVAAATSLDVGSTFFGTHGLVSVPGGEVHRDFPYTVTGVLEPTGTAQDRAIFSAPSPPSGRSTRRRIDFTPRSRTALLADQGEREATSVLIRLETPGLRLLMADEIRERSDGIAAVPINEILRFQRGVIGPVQRSLLAIAAAVVAVACLTVLTTLHQAGERRRRDIAILRNLGAVRLEVAALVFIEGVLLTGTGLVLGLLLGHGGLALGSATVREATGLVLDPWHVTRPELLAVVAMALCGSLASSSLRSPPYRRTPIADLQLIN